MAEELDVSTDQIREWRSIVTLIVFVVTSMFSAYMEQSLGSLGADTPYRSHSSLSVPCSHIHPSATLECGLDSTEYTTNNTAPRFSTR
jgi:hypothetical protein